MASFRIGDVVLQQFTRDWQMLAVELGQLHMQKRQAVARPADYRAISRIETRVGRLAEQFERQRTLFDAGFHRDWLANPEVVRLRKTLSDISRLITEILALGQPDRGKGLLSKALSDFREKTNQLHPTYKTTIGAVQPMITLPGVPQQLTGDPWLAIAILLDLLRLLVARSRKPE